MVGFHSNTKNGIQGHMNFPCPLGIRNYASSVYPSQILLLDRDLGCIPNRALVNKSHSITNQSIWVRNFHQYQHMLPIENNQYNFSCILQSFSPLFRLVILQATPAELAPLHRSQGQTRRLSFKETIWSQINGTSKISTRGAFFSWMQTFRSSLKTIIQEKKKKSS